MSICQKVIIGSIINKYNMDKPKQSWVHLVYLSKGMDMNRGSIANKIWKTSLLLPILTGKKNGK